MIKSIVPFYIICVALYILFSRRPDYQDGEITTATIHYVADSANKAVPEAVFRINKDAYTVNAGYVLRNLKEGQTVQVIYETSDPSKAAVYSWWGYWLQWDELLGSILIPVIFFFAAKEITARPAPEAPAEEMEMRNPPKQRKYDV
ncbi:DUF3592 domain-containing protein [Parafilimonas sp.]|uniref:DUF3592 domain-containing protein n=1 Tax=Parafilimonas sp. TaxID=1969739 RepID=UPI0039E27B58